MTANFDGHHAWRIDNAEWLRMQLRRLRLRLHRHALWLNRGGGAPRDADWLLAHDDTDAAQHFFEKHAGIGAIDAAHQKLDHEIGALEQRMGPNQPALLELAERVPLTRFETDLLLLASAPALDAAFGRAYAELHDDPRRDYATLQLGLALMVDGATDRLLVADSLMTGSALRSLRLIVADAPAQPLLTCPLHVEERVANYLRGVNRMDAGLATILSAVAPSPAEPPTRTATDLLAALTDDASRWPVVNLIGTMDAGGGDVAGRGCEAAGLALYALDLARFTGHTADERSTIVSLLGREAALAGIAVLVDARWMERDSPPGIAVGDLIARLAAPLIIVSPERWPDPRCSRVIRLEKPARDAQRVLWRHALERHRHSVNGEVDAIVQQFDFGPPAIAESVERASQDADGVISAADLWRACREQHRRALDGLAYRLTPCHGWDDIVVSSDVRAQLRELADQVGERNRVYDTWGFGTRLGRGRGITALFAGPSGAGKTMAAEILAGHLSLDLYRIDLAGLLSKYVGETEKNLRRIFDAAEQSGAILLFDEADALFGTRTEVRDSHDRYANIEINYLLQRMEDYTGLAILCTNRRTSLDQAFMRRLRFVIDFPFPDAGSRRRMWERVFPAEASLEGVEYGVLSQLQVTGGNIRTIAVNAAFLAAAERSPITMAHVMRAAGREYTKLSQPISDVEFGAYAAMVRP